MKDLFCGVFNLNKQVFIEYAYASSERQAWFVICRRLAKKTGVHSSVTMNHFDGNSDNFKIRKELEFEESNNESA